jgi:hypothetical protein
MKRSYLLIYLILLAGAACDKTIEVSSVDQIPGEWRWESTCGVFDTDYECITASKKNYATIEFSSDGYYTEKHLDTVYLQTKYSIIKSSDMFGTLILEDPAVSRPVTIMNNALLIQRGAFEDSYTKIR